MANDDAGSAQGQGSKQGSGPAGAKSAKGAKGSSNPARSGNPAKAAQAAGSAGSGKPASAAKGASPSKASTTDRRTPVRLDSPRWLVPTMIACFIIGLIWIAVWYIAPEAPLFKDLDFWNVAIGFGFIMIGFVLSTRWR